MFKVHILDVRHGDSIVIESQDGDERHWSLIDCASFSARTPTVDFLRSKNVEHIQSIFLSHMDFDHISGLGNLVDYLIKNDIPVEAIYTPVLPADADVKTLLLDAVFSDKNSLKRVVKAMTDFPLLKNKKGEATPISRGLHIATRRSYWEDDIHPGLDIAFISPNEHQTMEYMKWLLYANPRKHKNNDLSHVMLVRPHGEDDIYLFPGDLDSRRLRNVKNLANRVTDGQFGEHVRFIKAPHHGVLTKPVEELFDEVHSKDATVHVCVSCKPGDNSHPNSELLRYVDGGKYSNCILSCTGLSPHCKKLVEEDESFKVPHDYKRYELERFVKLGCKDAKRVPHSPCHGSITIARDDAGEFSMKSETGRHCVR